MDPLESAFSALGLFINTNNEIYVPKRGNGGIEVWYNTSIYPIVTINRNFSDLNSIFVTTINSDIYIYNSQPFNHVEKVVLNTSNNIIIMPTDLSCFELFLDVTNSVYCSVDIRHMIVKKWLDDNTTLLTTVAGTGTTGSASNMLNYPNGIFVHTNLDLYVADFSNDRIQLFRSGTSNGITVTGSTSLTVIITLYRPLGVVVDTWNSRIVGQGSNGFQCLVGCFGRSPSSDQLNTPRTLSLNSDGNMFVTDGDNNRIQKFLFITDSCGKFSTFLNTLFYSMFYFNENIFLYS